VDERASGEVNELFFERFCSGAADEPSFCFFVKHANEYDLNVGLLMIGLDLTSNGRRIPEMNGPVFDEMTVEHGWSSGDGCCDVKGRDKALWGISSFTISSSSSSSSSSFK
jgi:hypothetical protein